MEFLVLDHYIGSSFTILLHYKAVPGIYAKEKQRNFLIFELWLTNVTLSDFVNLASQRNNDHCLAGFQELMITLTSSITLVFENNVHGLSQQQCWSNNVLQRECRCNKCLRIMYMAYHNDNTETITYYNENVIVISVWE